MKTSLLLLCVAAAQAFVPSGTRIAHPSPSPVATGAIPTFDNASRAKLYASTTASTSEEPKSPTVSKSILSASALVVLDIAFRRLFQRLAISFPSSLGGCCALFVTLLTLPFGQGLFNVLSPGAALLAKWLPVFFVPSLITLPLVGSVGNAAEVKICRFSLLL
jgi:putative effector of murein hydrolase LrgA (UPF0299 family)